MCGVVSQLVTISSPTSGARTFPTNDNSFTFTLLNSNTSYDVTIALRYKKVQTRTRSIVIKTSPSYRMSSIITIIACITDASNLVLNYTVVMHNT